MNETLTRTLCSLLIESIEYNQPISDKQAKQASFEDFLWPFADAPGCVVCHHALKNCIHRLHQAHKASIAKAFIINRQVLQVQ